MRTLLIISVFLLGINNIPSFAQEVNDTSKTEEKTFYLVKKTDGGEFYGYILSDDGREILLETKAIGKIYINKADIKEIRVVKEDQNTEVDIENYGDFRATGPFTTRYYFTTNALPIKKKENYAMLHLYGPEVHFSLSDNLSLGVMATWIASPIALATKYSFNSEGKTHIAIGSIIGSSGYLINARGYGGLHWLTVSHGRRVSNISFSGGFGYVYMGDDFIDLGETYKFQNNYPAQDYYIPKASAQNALFNKLLAGNDDQYDQALYNTSLIKAGVFGVSGIAPVGDKASFIFDSMIFFAESKKAEYTPEDVTVTYLDYDNQYQDINGNWISPSVTETYTVGRGTVVDGGMTTSILLMPGMRFNQSHSKAFQVTLAGIIHIDNEGELNTFPIPMVSWLRQF